MKKLSAFLAISSLVLIPAAAEAQRFGAQVGYGTEVEGVALGVRAEFDLTNVFSHNAPWSNMMFVPAFDFYFPDCAAGLDCSYWELTPALVLPFQVQGSSMRPYFGAGLSFARMRVESGGVSGSNSETGLALLGGLRFPLNTMTAFTEARITLHDYDQLTLAFGLLFGGPKR